MTRAAIELMFKECCAKRRRKARASSGHLAVITRLVTAEIIVKQNLSDEVKCYLRKFHVFAFCVCCLLIALRIEFFFQLFLFQNHQNTKILLPISRYTSFSSHRSIRREPALRDIQSGALSRHFSTINALVR